MIKIIPILTLVTFFTVLSQIFIKKGLARIQGIQTNNLSSIISSFVKLIQEKYFIIGAVFALASAFFWIIVISKKDLTIAFPVAGGIFYIILFIFSWILASETITVWKIIGVVLIFSGIAFLATKG